MSQILVHKYGGSSLSSPELIKKIAAKINELRKTDTKIIMVVSAMGSHTNELMKLARAVSPEPHPRELDMLLTTGERVSMALMSMALHDLGCPSISFTGSQAGILTDGSHNDASITHLKPIRIEEELKGDKVIVIAGFQGVNPETKEITTLGRGGSDTTAVALASHFNADRCEVFKDTDGVYSCDPNFIARPTHYSHLSYKQAYRLAINGAKVLHHKCVEFAEKSNTPIVVSASHFQGKSTLISSEPYEFKIGDCIALTSQSTQESTSELNLLYHKQHKESEVKRIENALNNESISFDFTEVFEDHICVRVPENKHKASLEVLHHLCIES